MSDNYIRLTLAANTADGRSTRVHLNSAHVTNNVHGSGPRKLGEPGTIDHSKSGGRRQHNLPDDLKIMYAKHNNAGKHAWEKMYGINIDAQVSQGKNIVLIHCKFVTLFSKAILDNELEYPPMSGSCAVCSEAFGVNISVMCSKCDRSFCRTCHRPNISADVPVEPQQWACSYCIAVMREGATLSEIAVAIEHTKAMDEIQRDGLGGGQAISAGELADMMQMMQG